MAVGGYGRSELSPFSDVDLMVLHDLDDPSDLAATVFRPLWDANLRVGHSIRTVAEATSAARERFETHTTLITSRLVAGSRPLFEQLTAQVGSVTRARPLRRHLVEEERERRRRSPYIRMATDVKNGRGGLRTLQAFGWVETREQMIGRYSAESFGEEARAYEILLEIRNALHVAAGRRYDVYSSDLREPVARWLGKDPFDVAKELIWAVESADRIASRRWPEVTDAPGSRRFARFRRPRDFRTDRPPSAHELVDLLRSGERGRLALERLRDAGHLREILPEWDVVRALPQVEPFHEHPVGAHLWRTVDEMQQLVEGDDGHYRGVADEVGSPVALTLAAFLHDIGKGRGGDHSEAGARIARSVCLRLGCSEEVALLVEAAVRHHLVLGRTASRRDIDDRAVIEDVAQRVGNLRTLQLLYLLTVADSRATGPAMWSQWKATLLRTLFVRVAGRFGADRPLPGREARRKDILDRVEEARRARVLEHLDSMSEDYLDEATPEDVLRHVDRLESLNGGFVLDVQPGEVADGMLLVGRPYPGLRRIVAEALAANGVDVLEARLRSRSDGTIIDSFVVHDDRTGGSVRADRWALIRADIEAALSGELDTTNKVDERARTYAGVGAGGDFEPEVKIYRDSATGEPVLAIRCEDRIGRLAELLAILSGVGVEIGLAKLDSRAGELIDTFHLRQESIPADASSVRRLEERIASSLK